MASWIGDEPWTVGPYDDEEGSWWSVLVVIAVFVVLTFIAVWRS